MLAGKGTLEMLLSPRCTLYDDHGMALCVIAGRGAGEASALR
jgi:hypothetical protein